MELKMTKTITKTFELGTYGKFRISMARNPKNLPHIIPLRELIIDHSTSMPFTKEQEEKVLKLMKDNKTDILTDGGYLGFYTRAGQGEFASLCHIAHPKLVMYREDDGFKLAVDSE